MEAGGGGSSGPCSASDFLCDLELLTSLFWDSVSLPVKRGLALLWADQLLIFSQVSLHRRTTEV